MVVVKSNKKLKKAKSKEFKDLDIKISKKKSKKVNKKRRKSNNKIKKANPNSDSSDEPFIIADIEKERVVEISDGEKEDNNGIEEETERDEMMVEEEKEEEVEDESKSEELEEVESESIIIEEATESSKIDEFINLPSPSHILRLNSQNAIIALKRENRIGFIGSAKIKVIQGTINISYTGLEVGSKGIIELFSPYLGQILFISPTNNTSNNTNHSTTTSNLQSYFNKLNLPNTSLIDLLHWIESLVVGSTTYDNSTDQQSLTYLHISTPANDTYDSSEQNIQDSLFQLSSFFALDSDTCFQNYGLPIYRIPPIWQEVINGNNSPISSILNSRKPSTSITPIMITGNANTGKSSLARLLFAKILLSNEGLCYWLDCDIGQTEFGPPGFITLYLAHRVSPFLGSPLTHSQYTKEIPPVDPITGQRDLLPGVLYKVSSCFYGSSTPSTNPQYYASCLDSVLNQFSSLSTTLPIAPLIINTLGWTKSLGLELLSHTFATTRPDVLIELDRTTQIMIHDSPTLITPRSHMPSIVFSLPAVASKRASLNNKPSTPRRYEDEDEGEGEGEGEGEDEEEQNHQVENSLTDTKEHNILSVNMNVVRAPKSSELRKISLVVHFNPPTSLFRYLFTLPPLQFLPTITLPISKTYVLFHSLSIDVSVMQPHHVFSALHEKLIAIGRTTCISNSNSNSNGLCLLNPKITTPPEAICLGWIKSIDLVNELFHIITPLAYLNPSDRPKFNTLIRGHSNIELPTNLLYSSTPFLSSISSYDQHESLDSTVGSGELQDNFSLKRGKKFVGGQNKKN